MVSVDLGWAPVVSCWPAYWCMALNSGAAMAGLLLAGK